MLVVALIHKFKTALNAYVIYEVTVMRPCKQTDGAAEAVFKLGTILLNCTNVCLEEVLRK